MVRSPYRTVVIALLLSAGIAAARSGRADLLDTTPGSAVLMAPGQHVTFQVVSINGLTSCRVGNSSLHPLSVTSFIACSANRIMEKLGTIF